jgi:3-hydroxybutyrate dehydrogenase
MNIAMTQREISAAQPLKDKVSLVTGSTSGIGLGIARALAAAGSPVILNGFGKPEEIKSTLGVQGFGLVFRRRYVGPDLDRGDDQDGARHIRQPRHSREQRRRPARRTVAEFSVAKWDAIMAINLSSAFHTTRLALPSMIAKKWGRIINIASAHGLVGSAFKSAYVAAKHGMLGLTKVTALETASELGITCNAICPGYVYTPLVEAQIDGQAKTHGIPREQVIRDVLLAQQPNKRFATTDELGGTAVFLCSDTAASITGTLIAVDGGWTAH